MIQVNEISDKNVNTFTEGLRTWRSQHGLRDYPWRRTNSSFQILVTEIMLRRTRADTVASVWHDFFRKFKSFDDIRVADRAELESHLEQLGLVNHRIQTLKRIAEEVQDGIPETVPELMDLFGVGRYIAGLTVIMSENSKEIVYDTNFRRVYNRYFGLEIIKDLKRDPVIDVISNRVIPEKDPREFVLTLLDFAALQCKPRTPECEDCVLNTNCQYFTTS